MNPKAPVMPVSRRGALLAAAGAFVVLLVMAGASWACVPPRAVVLLQPQPSGPPGADVNVVGLGFNEEEKVELRWNAVDGPELGSASGPDFNVTIKVPDVGGGLYTVVVLSRSVNGALGTTGSAPFLVTGAPATSPTSKPALTPNTLVPTEVATSPTSPVIWLGVLGLVFGLVILAVWSRRRRALGRTEPQPG